jgi:hypothetical protein
MTSAMRQSAQNTLQHLLASELAAATFATDPLQKIRHVIEAYMMLDEDKRKIVLPEEKDRDEVGILYKNCLSFMRITDMPSSAYDPERYAFIPWSFASMQAYHYMRCYVHYYPMEDYDEPTTKRLQNGDKAVWEWHLNTVARRTGAYAPLSECLKLRSWYIDYTMPKMIRLLREIHEKFITPEVWESTISSMRGGKVKHDSGDAGTI